MELFKRRRIEAHIDMTPMIDTLLQLFLIFMLGATLASSTVNIDLPRVRDDHPTSQDLSRLVSVSIDNTGRVYLDRRQVSRSRLHADLQQLARSTRQVTVLLQADRKLVYEEIIQLMVEIRQTGVARVMLAYQPEPGPPVEQQ